MVVNFFKPFYLTLIQSIFLVTLRMSTMLNVIYFTVKSHKDGRKQHTCKYCKKKVFKIPHHLEDCQENITKVAHDSPTHKNQKSTEQHLRKFVERAIMNLWWKDSSPKKKPLPYGRVNRTMSYRLVPIAMASLGQNSSINIPSTVLLMSSRAKEVPNYIATF